MIHRRRSLHLAPLAALLLAASVGAQTPAPKRLRVIQTTDVHGRILPQTPSWANGRVVGGSAVLAAYVDSARARFAADGPTIVLSGGDAMQGTSISNLSDGRATIAAMNAVGYDAAALGNHEFDWGQATLRARIAQSRFPWLAANLYVVGTRRNPTWVRPWTMLRRGGLRVAVIGAAYEQTPEVVRAGMLDGLEFGPAAPAIDRSAREARAAGADFVIITLHEGATCEQSGRAPEALSVQCTNEDVMRIARQLQEPVDLIVGGHRHRRVLVEVGGVLSREGGVLRRENPLPVMVAASLSTAFAQADLERRPGSTAPRATVLARGVYTPFADSVRPDARVARVVASWAERVKAVSAREVARLAQPLERRGLEYPLGNLLADAFRVAANTDAAIVNNGSIRRDLPAGTLTYGTLFELQPFQNILVRVSLTGAQLRAALENALGDRGVPDAHISGLTVRYDPAAPAGARVRQILRADGRPVADGDSLTLGVTDFLSTGGDRYTMLRDAPQRGLGILDIDALITYLQSLPQPVTAPVVGRWVPTTSAGSAR